MEVLKFGGTSVGSCENMQHVLNIITNDHKRKVVVLSAMAGTTNKLKEIAKAIDIGNQDQAFASCQELKEEYFTVAEHLFEQAVFVQQAKEKLEAFFELIASFINQPFSLVEESILSAQGELISTELFHLLCQDKGISSVLLPALDYMKLNEEGCPDNAFIKAKLQPLIDGHRNTQFFITQGYICQNYLNEIDNLGRGGSDYTATIIGAILQAEEIQIWTDIDGVHNNDPRFVKPTVPVAQLSYEEASLLAYYGAKILHPTSVIPARERGIPLRVKNTFEPNANGTLIQDNCQQRVNYVVSAKAKERLIQVHSNNKLSCSSFLLKIFEICHRQQIELDMVSVAHQAVSLVINEKFNIDKLTQAFTPYGKVSVDLDYAIINVVGNELNRTSAIDHIFHSLQSIPIKMVNQSKAHDCSHMQLLVDAKDQVDVLTILNMNVLKNRVLSKVEAPIR